MTTETPLSAKPAAAGDARTEARESRGASDSRQHGDGRARTLFSGYSGLAGCYDEIVDGDGQFRRDVRRFARLLDALGPRELERRQRLADGAFRQGGITFSVYSDARGVEKIFPFDLIPRVVTAREWAKIERGLVQRVQALNLFLADVYGPQKILEEKPVLRDLVQSSTGHLPKVDGIKPPLGVYVHVAGIDLVRRPDGAFVVLEDNLRVPSGVSYVIENRRVMKRALAGVFHRAGVRSVSDYPVRLREVLSSFPGGDGEGAIVVLTPGPYNSAYFEHSFLARRMGVPLVEGRDLFVKRKRVYLKTTEGPRPVTVIYRRIDDEFLDPETFRADSMLGIAGLVEAYRAGNVTLANAIGNGAADDKAVYAAVPEIIRFYLAEEAILPQVPTFLCRKDEDRSYVLSHLTEMVVKEVSGSGGYGMLVGPKASRAEVARMREAIQSKPRGFIAQPVVELSSCPAWVGKRLVPRRVDLRPYVITGSSTWVLPGGLTRVALREGSYVVNSSQGGGSKDTWVLRPSSGAGSRDGDDGGRGLDA
jgi:uncharacterized circularly permuted ATP-grasp superfamily protein